MFIILPTKVCLACVEKGDHFTAVGPANTQDLLANIGQPSIAQQLTQRCCFKADFIGFLQDLKQTENGTVFPCLGQVRYE